ncbi:MAG: low-specificity D-threonine aldolase [Herminiimonas sp.]|nr:low-specificity D-threonine aldolase [Herminiimonas sp.]
MKMMPTLASLDSAANWRTAPAAIGMPIAAIDTPALLVDLDALEVNLANVHDLIHAAGIAVRPHAKAHKSVDLARRQIAAGAIGICCQKASEAEVFVRAGFRDVLITNQVIGQQKCERVARLATQARIGLCVDHPEQVRQIGEATRAAGSLVELLVEVDIGHGRCGVADAAEALALAHAIKSYDGNLLFGGIHAFRGSAQHMRGPGERAQAVHAAVLKLTGIVEVLKGEGFSCSTITGGGTGTYALEAGSHLYTEVQPGSYVLMDTDYAANRLAADMPPLRHALQALCSVISVHSGHAVLDGGLKAFAVDQGLPQILHAGWKVNTISDEHCVVLREAGALPLEVGDKVRLLPSHCDPTVNLHDWLIAVRGGVVEEIWPVSARGAVF